ncbi:MAG: hypothetical protein WA639_25760, partial [Candidatus Acidiferrum sp.]
MSTITILKPISTPVEQASRFALALFFSAALLPSLALGRNAIDPPKIDPPVPGNPAPRVAMDRSGVVPTQDGLTLHLTTDLGSVRVVALEPGAAPVVRYTVHIETDARVPL